MNDSIPSATKEQAGLDPITLAVGHGPEQPIAAGSDHHVRITVDVEQFRNVERIVGWLDQFANTVADKCVTPVASVIPRPAPVPR